MKNITTVYINDYDGEVKEKLRKLKNLLEERVILVDKISEKKHEFLMKRKDVIKNFLGTREYYSKETDKSKDNETFYREANSHRLKLYLFDFIHILVISGQSYHNYKIDLWVNDKIDKFENISAIDNRDDKINFYGLEKIDETFLDMEIEKLYNNIEIFKYRLDNFKEDDLIYVYEDTTSIELKYMLESVLNETKI